MSRGRSLKRFMKEHREIHRIAKTIAVLYGLVYYFSAGFLRFELVKVYKQVFVPEVGGMIFKMRAPFLWESIALFEIPPFIVLYISPMNLLLMLLLMWLVYKNLILFITGIRYPRVCQLTRNKGKLAALLPALFTGFSCCAPTVLIMLAGILGGFGATLLIVFRWAIPFSIVLLVYGIVQGYKSLHLHYPV